MRVGRSGPSVVRLVFDLKAEVKPQVFALAPVGEYGHRLVLDLYPVDPLDPLMALLEDGEAQPTRSRRATPPAPRRSRTPRSADARREPQRARA